MTTVWCHTFLHFFLVLYKKYILAVLKYMATYHDWVDLVFAFFFFYHKATNHAKKYNLLFTCF